MKIKIIESFRCAFRGLKYALQEQTMKIMLFIAFLITGLMIFFGITFFEKTVILLTITLVLGLELINSQVEKTLDIINPEFSKEVRKIKDISAGAVLVASIGSILIGVLIFLPYFLSFMGIE